MKEFDELVQVVDALRDKVNGCPWDAEQTSESLIPNFIEEVYEAVEAIEKKDTHNLKEELGDVLLHVLFQAQIADENKDFGIKDVVKQLNDKLIRRHPHVFGENKANSGREAKHSWESVKRLEKKERKSILDGIPSGMPSLIIASRMQEKADALGFSWDSAETILKKINEEFGELQQAVSSQDKDQVQEEFGDLLFALVSFANHHKIDSESSLRLACSKFKKRFGYIEEQFKSRDKSFADSTVQEMEDCWQEAKKKGL